MSFEKLACPLLASGKCNRKTLYHGNSWFISHLNSKHSEEERKGLNEGDFSFDGLNILCECGFIRKTALDCINCNNSDPRPPSVEDLSGRKGKAPVSEWVGEDSGEEWALLHFGDEWRSCFLDFEVVGRDDEDDDFWVLRYPTHDFDEDHMEHSRVKTFLLPEQETIDLVGSNLDCKECDSHVGEGLDCSSCSAKIHNQCGVRLRQDLLCLSCFKRKSSEDEQAIFDLFKTYRGKNMFSMQAVCLALDVS